ncbi:hypothetical protein ACFLR2_00405 [Chlamydiota bacterium]
MNRRGRRERRANHLRARAQVVALGQSRSSGIGQNLYLLAYHAGIADPAYLVFLSPLCVLCDLCGEKKLRKSYAV